MLFTERFCEVLTKSGRKQSELAEYCFITRQSISDFKRGKSVPSIETLFYICKFFNVSSDYLLGLEQEVVAPMPQQQIDPEFLKIYQCLTPEQQENLRYYVQGMTASNEMRNHEQSVKKTDIA